MKTETFFIPSEVRQPAPWMVLTLVGAVVVVLLGLCWPTTYSIYAIWKRSETFAHGFVIVPAVLWLLWRDRNALSQIQVRPAFGALALVAAAGLIWLLARLAPVLSASQFALLLIVEFSVIAIVGVRVSRRIVFPLAFLSFAIPFGEFLMPWLMDGTADITVGLLKLSGVPVYREANHLQIPSGPWSIVEACSGLRYLIASLVAGVLYAYLRYSSFKRRLIFICAAVAVPVVANWLRAYGIVMLAHFSNNRLGTNVDHIIYGWLFFGVVMGLLFWIGSWWEEPGAAQPSALAPEALPAGTPRPVHAIPLLVVSLLCIVLTGIWPIALRYLETGPSAPPQLRPILVADGWSATNDRMTEWRPRFIRPAAELNQQVSQDGHSVGIYVAYYRNQDIDRKLISTENKLVREDDPIWKILWQKDVSQTLRQETLAVHTALLKGGAQQLLTRHWYWVDGHYTASPSVAAMWMLISKLARHGDDAAAIVLYTPVSDQPQIADAILDRFAATMAEPLAQALTRTSLER